MNPTELSPRLMNITHTKAGEKEHHMFLKFCCSLRNHGSAKNKLSELASWEMFVFPEYFFFRFWVGLFKNIFSFCFLLPKTRIPEVFVFTSFCRELWMISTISRSVGSSLNWPNRQLTHFSSLMKTAHRSCQNYHRTLHAENVLSTTESLIYSFFISDTEERAVNDKKPKTRISLCVCSSVWTAI